MPEGPETHRMSDNIKKSLKGKNILSFKFEHKALYPLKDLKHIAVAYRQARAEAALCDFLNVGAFSSS